MTKNAGFRDARLIGEEISCLARRDPLNFSKRLGKQPVSYIAKTQEYEMPELLRLCRFEEVREGEPLAISIDSLPPLAVYRWSDDYFVTDNICTHGEALLTDGYQDGNMIECPFHAGRFDVRTGDAVASPCHIPLKTYAVSLADGWISIERPL